MNTDWYTNEYSSSPDISQTFNWMSGSRLMENWKSNQIKIWSKSTYFCLNENPLFSVRRHFWGHLHSFTSNLYWDTCTYNNWNYYPLVLKFGILIAESRNPRRFMTNKQQWLSVFSKGLKSIFPSRTHTLLPR